MCVCVLLPVALRKGTVMASDGGGAGSCHTTVSSHSHPFLTGWFMVDAFISVFAHSISTWRDAFLFHLLVPLPSSGPSALHHEGCPQLIQWEWLISSLGFCLYLIWNSVITCLPYIGVTYPNLSNSCDHLEDQDLWFTSGLATVLCT